MVTVRIFFFFSLTVALSMQIVMFAYAQNSDSRKIVAPNEIIEGDYVAAGETVEISGLVKGDVYVLGGQVLINGTVEGDVLALGGVVSIAGIVDNNVRVAGWQVIVSGKVGRNLTAGGLNIQMTKESILQGTVMAGGANIIMQGRIHKPIRVAGKNLTITNDINGSVDAAVENIRLVSGANILGNFTYWSNRDASIGEGVVIKGSVTKKASEGIAGYIHNIARPVTELLNPYLKIVSFVTSLLLGVLVIKLFPNFARQTVLALRTKKWRSFTSGISAVFIIPIVFGILIITIIGIPLGFMLLLLSSVILYTARIFVMLLLGMIISEKLNKNISDTWAFVLGLIAYTVLSQMPVMGWIISLSAALFGVGASVQAIKDKYFTPNRIS